MRTFLRGKITLLFMALGLLLALPAVALADTLFITNAVAVNSNDTKNPGDTGTARVYVKTTNGTPTGDTNGCNVRPSEPLTVELKSNNPDVTFPNGDSVQITDCVQDNNSDLATDSGSVAYQVASGSNGGTAVISVDTYSGGRTDGTRTYVTTDTLTVTINPPPNTAPSVPNAPSGTSPNQGAFTLNWDDSTDDGKPAGSSITYTLQHKDANDTSFSTVATGLSGSSYTFGGSNAVEAEGTWTYRVSASDGTLSSAFSAASSAIVVDQSRPNAPLANEGTPTYTAPNGEKWFLNSASVSFTANGDPDLTDGSLGSGVASVSPAQSRSTTGALNYSGSATDNVGLVSLLTSGTVHVDATAPVASITCPTNSAILGSSASANWTASDVGSGLATAANGSVALDTSAIASKTATAPTATDNVGLQSATATCNYSVAAAFNGFFQPIDGNLVNTGKYGRVYPVKWQLSDASGALLSDADAQALVSSMTVTQRAVTCDTGVPADALETEAGAAGSTSVRYDAASDQFIFNYKAPSSGSCYSLNVNKADGINTKSILFKFTK